ncbi:uncharacterized protein A4U43_C05F26030 [Asparagus officinalis]|uniref:RNA polymerase II C-terminal domain phosphatase-like n=1 Tax=Asparagus officinalis TaxID=4686 RepID=A0A5P1EZ21_ASPOF|nr:RNA polymerase II C-terminal domain phosphatase-like 4 [Asparagus officinalis]XP_020264823.1 RNA polymerase II C-terminal domain phosphatase-like 4 [Asparagus officinalis]ONK69721.1 uncharacterized protein A4U43_C05F26030 [Asparagus officinalis]
MSLAAESPVHSSSSSDDFAAFLDAELDVASSDTSPDEDQDDEENDDDEEDFQEPSAKRQKVEDLEPTKELEGSNVNTSSEPMDEDICPPHPGFIKGMCMRCGQIEEDESGVAFGYIHKDLRLNSKEIDRLRGVDLKNLLEAKKLILILDLDHTVLNSARLVEISAEEEYLRHQALSMQADADRSIFELPGMHLLTKLRPFVRTFLEEATKMFEIYIYTMADRAYALEIAKILDPDKVYFDNRIISNADCTKRHQKGLDVVLGAESLVLIMDDTEIVWQRHKENLILMERYHFFASSRRQFGFSTKSLSETKKDESESDGILSIVLNVLKRAHQMFFDAFLEKKLSAKDITELSSRDVRKVLKLIRQEILQGCKIVFSRVFPSSARAEDQPIWKLAQQLGAICSTEVDASVTHVVSTDKTTEKARWALQNGKFLVNVHWIEAANFLWSRQREEDFQITSSPKNPPD